MIFTNRDTASDGVQADEVLMMHVMYSCRLVHAGQMVQWLRCVADMVGLSVGEALITKG